MCEHTDQQSMEDAYGIMWCPDCGAIKRSRSKPWLIPKGMDSVHEQMAAEDPMNEVAG